MRQRHAWRPAGQCGIDRQQRLYSPANHRLPAMCRDGAAPPTGIARPWLIPVACQFFLQRGAVWRRLLRRRPGTSRRQAAGALQNLPTCGAGRSPAARAATLWQARRDHRSSPRTTLQEQLRKSAAATFFRMARVAAADAASPALGAGLPRKFYSLTPRLPDAHCYESVTNWHGFCTSVAAARAVTFNLLFEVRP